MPQDLFLLKLYFNFYEQIQVHSLKCQIAYVGVPAGLQGLETLCGKQAQMILNPEAPVWVCMGGCGLGVGADCETGHFLNSFFSVECVC